MIWFLNCESVIYIFLIMKTWKISLWEETGRLWVSQVVAVVKNPAANARGVRHVRSIPGWEDPLEGARQPTPVFLPGESYGQRRLRAVVHRVAESDVTEADEHTPIQEDNSGS